MTAKSTWPQRPCGFFSFRIISVFDYFTVTFTFFETPAADTVIVALPFFTPFTMPLLVTVAIFLFEVLYVTFPAAEGTAALSEVFKLNYDIFAAGNRGVDSLAIAVIIGGFSVWLIYQN